jgi:hypothetical protein
MADAQRCVEHIERRVWLRPGGLTVCPLLSPQVKAGRLWQGDAPIGPRETLESEKQKPHTVSSSSPSEGKGETRPWTQPDNLEETLLRESL